MPTDDEKKDTGTGKAQQPENLVEFFGQSPLVGLELDLVRNRDPGRDVDLGLSLPPEVGTVDPIPQK